jgi:hypothetical protein
MQIYDAYENMIYGYARASTAAQDESGQVRPLKAAGCERIFRERVTGTTAERPQLGKLMKELTPGDVVITPAVDRLSRDTTDLLVIAREMPACWGRYPVTGRALPRYDFRLCRDRLRYPRCRREAGAPPYPGARARADARARSVKFGRKPILTPHQ